MTATVSSDTGNPFVGPHALTETNPIFGREVELRTLHDLLIAERIVVLYSPSGAGKTSLLHARNGLRNLLVEDGFDVRPTIRVNYEMPPAIGGRPPTNRFVASTLLSLEGERKDEMDSATLATLGLDEYLTSRPAASDDGIECLFFDQFEELFTVDPLGREEKRRFLEGVGQVLRDRSRWAVFSMREDYFAHVDPHLSLLPTRLRTRFRLDLLAAASAQRAIQQTAAVADVEFTPAAASLVVDDLRTVRMQQGAASVPVKGPTVEPVQLQVVCRRICERLGDATTVEPEHVRELGNVDNALREFYDDVVGDVARGTGVSERVLRTWISDELLTEQLRVQVRRGPPEDGEGLVLPALEDAHVVRADSRRGAVWYELAHDRLVDPVRSSNTAWLGEHLSDVQRGALLWEAQHRADGALLMGKELEAADAWAARHRDELVGLDQEFLEASHEREAERGRQLRRTRRVLAVVAVLALCALVAAVLAVHQWRRATQAANAAKAGELAAVAGELSDHSLDRSLLLAVEAHRRDPGPEAMASLLTSLARVPTLERILRGHDEEVRAVATSDGGTVLASAGRDETIVVWDRSDAFERRISGQGGEVHSLAFSPDGSTLVSGNADGTLRRWDPASGEPIGEPLTGHTDEVRGIAIDPDGRWLASTSHDRTVRLWDLDTEEPRTTLRDHDDLALDVAFNADGTLFASVGADGAVVVRRTDDLAGVGRLDLGDPVRAIDFDPTDPDVVAVGSNDGTVVLWDVREQSPSARLTGHGERVFDVAFSPDGRQVASAGRDQTVVVHDVATGGVVQRHDAHGGDVRAVAYWPDGDLASGSRDGTVMLWDLQRSQRLARSLTDDPSSAVAFRPDGRRVAIMTVDGVLTVVDPSSTSEPRSRRVGRVAGPASVEYTPDGEAIATGTADGAVEVWSAERLTSRWRVADGHRGGVHAVAVDEHEALVASGGEDRQVAVWDAQSGRSLARLDLAFPVVDITFGPDARTIIATDANGTLWGWRRAGDRWERQEVADNQVRSLHLSLAADDSRLAVGTSQDRVTVWALAGGLPSRPTAQLDHDGDVVAVAARANRIAAASAERATVTLWQLGSGRPLGTLPIASPTAVALGPTGLSLAIAGGTGAELWDLRVDHLVSEACGVANRNLTEEEWQLYVGGAYRETCPGAEPG